MAVKRKRRIKNKMDRHNEGRFMNGFVLGLLVGGGLMLLLTTRKGRMLLKELSENGLDIIDSLGDVKDSEQYEDDNPSQQAATGRNDENNGGSSGVKSLGRRFFKNVKKKG